MRKLTALLAAGLVLGASGMAMALDNATATATAVVVTPIAVSKTTDMVFGNIVPGNGLVTLDTSGGRTKSGSIVLSNSGSSPAAAKFSVTGTGENTFSIDYTDSSDVLTSGSDTMAINWITEAVSGVAGTATGKTEASTDATSGTLGSGAASIYAGAELTVGASQAPGTYIGDLKVTVAYN